MLYITSFTNLVYYSYVFLSLMTRVKIPHDKLITKVVDLLKSVRFIYKYL